MTPGRALGARNAIDTSKERQVFFDTQIVIQREFLRHVPELLADSLRAQAASLPPEFNLAGCGGGESARPFCWGGLSRALCAAWAGEPAGLYVNFDVLSLRDRPQG